MPEERLFSFQKMNKYFLMPFIIPITCFSTKFVSETMKTDNDNKDIKDVSDDNTHTFVFLYQIIQCFSLILGGLIYFIQLRHLKMIKQNKSEVDSSSELIESGERISKLKNLKDESDDSSRSSSKNDTELTVKTFNNFFFKYKDAIIIITMPLLLISYNLGIAYGVGHQQLEKRIYFLYFFTLIYAIFFKKQIYRHRKLALIITAIGAIPLYTAFGVYLNVDDYDVLYDIILFVVSFLFSLYLVAFKYLTHNKGISVFLLLLYQGTLSFIYTLIIYIIISLSRKGDLTYITNIFHCDENNFVCISHFYFNIIMFLLLNSFTYTLVYLVVYIFSPEFFAISDIFSPLFSFIYKKIINKGTNPIEIFLSVLGYLIIAFGAFIYTEIIICNFCRLNENTWKSIDKKACFDSHEIDKNYLLIDFDNNENDENEY